MPQAPKGLKTAYILWTLLFLPAIPLVIGWFLWRSLRDSDYRKGLGQRLGFVKKQSRQSIWVHAASVGEVNAAEPLVRALLESRPQQRLLLTTMTPTGLNRARELFGDQVDYGFVPIDWALFVVNFYFRARPKLAIVIETEIWPAIIAHAFWLDIPVVIANARLSEKSVVSYRKFIKIIKPLLSTLNVAAQSYEDAERFIGLGVQREKMTVTGNIKFDMQISRHHQLLAEQFCEQLKLAGKAFCWIAASTHEGEEEVALDAHAHLLKAHKNCLLILVPRHPERFDLVARLCRSKGLIIQRHSEGVALRQDTRVYLLDTMGELFSMYGVAHLAFVGGSMVPVGGHNLLEPAIWGCSLVSGPYTHNFSAIVVQLQSEGALKTIKNAGGLASVLVDAVDFAEQNSSAGDAAMKVALAGQGVLQKQIDVIEKNLR